MVEKGTGKRKKLLLIEDERASLLRLKTILEKNDFEVVTASNGKTAIELVTADREINMIITDITLEGDMDGIETIEAINKIGCIPVIFNSVHTEPDIIKGTEKVNAYGYVVKSSGEAVLMSAIRMAFRLYEANTSINNQKSEIEAANEEMQAAMEELEAINQELIDTQRNLIESETKFRAVLNQSPMPTMILTREGRFTDVNNAWVEIWGVLREDAIKYYELKKDTQAYTRILDYINRAFEGEVVDLPVLDYYSIKDGRKEPLWVGGKVYPLRDGNGGIENVVIVSEDVTDRVKAEKALRESEKKFRNIFENMTIGYFSTGLDGRLLDINPVCLRLFGFSSIDEARILLSDSSRNVYSNPDDWQMVRDRLGSGGGQFTGSVRMKRKNGSEFTALLNIRIAYSDEGKPDHIEGVLEDITERLKTQEILIQSEKMVTVAGLAAGMAHEINNPLGIIMQNAENSIHRLIDDLPGNRAAAEAAGTGIEKIRNYVQSRRIDSYLSSILDAGDRAAKIVSNMLQFSRSSESKYSYIDIHHVIDRALDLASNEFDIRRNYDFRNIKITKNYGVLPQIQCSESSMEQVFLNMLRNSAQAMNSARVDPEKEHEITISTKLSGENINIEIGDNGPGMDDETRMRIFEPFFSTKEPGSGTGLGLSVSYYIIVDGHGGNISVSSLPGEGAIFTVSLPVDRRE